MRLLIVALGLGLGGGVGMAREALAPSALAPAAWRLWSDRAAPGWTSGYPVGNGSLGGLTSGTFPKSQVFLNHDTIWAGRKHVALAADSRKAAMAEAFALCQRGDFAGAQAVYCKAKNMGNGVAGYQCLGSLSITHAAGAPQSLRRELDLFTGEALTAAKLADGELREILLASYPDRCLVMRLESTQANGLDCQLSMQRPQGVTRQWAEKNELGFDGQAANGGTKFATRVRVVPEPGCNVTVTGNELVIKGGKGATLIMVAATDYHAEEPRAPRQDDWAADAVKSMQAAASHAWPKLRQRAAADHQRLMGGCVVDLGTSTPEVAALSTPERLKKFQAGGEDPDLIELYFQLGRHMLVGSSRPGSLPPNLQGIWEAGLSAAWNGDFHLNINVEMNMWPATLTNLDECNEPYMRLISLIHRHGQETARSLGCRGYCAGLASDGWGMADFAGGSPEWDTYMLGGHWAQQALMERYRFGTVERKFLRETAWPILKDGSLFMLDWMREASPGGPLIAGPGSSPENAFRYVDASGAKRGNNIAIGNTHDHAIAWETFSDTLECAKLLGIKDDFTAQVAAALKRVPAPAIGTDGRIMEWMQPFEEVWTGHRHKSHLYGLYPGHQITMTGTPVLAAAAMRSLEVRMDPKNGDCAGGGRTGWNLAWSVNLWARLQQGDRALALIREQLSRQTNENLFNRCGGPFQIDGNCGTPAGIAEMLLQSHETTAAGRPLLRLLPALPAAWPSGSFTGLRARGGYIVDLTWKDGKVTQSRIRSAKGGSVTVVVNGETRTVEAGRLRQGPISERSE